jgi:hypothetical protein
VRPWASTHWLACSLTWKETWHEQWLAGRLTWLFFHDEAVALAAGHRPCALCRRSAYNAYRTAWAAGGRPPSFEEMDRRLHVERIQPGTRQRRIHPGDWSELPDGAFVMEQGHPALVRGRQLIAWTEAGYGDRHRRPRRGGADLLTCVGRLRPKASLFCRSAVAVSGRRRRAAPPRPNGTMSD